MSPVFNRVLLKLSGEALAGEQGYGIDPDSTEYIARRIKDIAMTGREVAVVIGGGNIWRGEPAAERGMDRSTADHIGMLATIMNGIALKDSLEKIEVQTRVQTAIQMNEIAEPYIRLRAIRHLEKGRVLILAGGTGNPYFTTDSAAALRAAEIHADVIVKATKVNGVYSADPKKDPNAIRYATLSHQEVLDQHLNVMDMTAFTLCQENDMPVIVVDFWSPDDLLKAIEGDYSVGTLVS